MSQDNKALVRRLVDEAINQGDLAWGWDGP
jgi:hypothetical protein